MDNQDLQFQDFGSDARLSDVKAKKDYEGTTYEFEHSGNIGDREKLLPDSNRSGDFGSESAGGPSFWTFEYYQQYFDVDTDQVVNRLINSFVPRIGGNFITQHVRPLPDLYGPFWIAVTLVFTTGIFGNLSQYIQTMGSHTTEHYYWTYDFRIVTAAASVIFGYVCVVPLLLYAFLWYRKSEVGYTYLEILCVYGYSLTIFVPVSMLWVINFDVVRWILIGIAVFLSGGVMFFTFWPAVKHDQKLLAVLSMVAILGLHILLAGGFKHYFFQSAHDITQPHNRYTSAKPISSTFSGGTAKSSGINGSDVNKLTNPPEVKASVKGPAPVKKESGVENKEPEVTKSAPTLKTAEEKAPKPKFPEGDSTKAPDAAQKENLGSKEKRGMKNPVTIATGTISVQSTNTIRKEKGKVQSTNTVRKEKGKVQSTNTIRKEKGKVQSTNTVRKKKGKGR